jgi:hypothetical protein
VPALQNFLRDELLRRDWSIEEFSRRALFSTSLGYQIVRDGKDNVRQDTFEGIATALSMTPAELMVTIGKGGIGDDPKRTPLYAFVRQIPDADLETAGRVIQAFTTARTANGQHADSDNRQPGRRRPLKAVPPITDETSGDGRIPTWKRSVKHHAANALAALRLANPWIAPNRLGSAI